MENPNAQEARRGPSLAHPKQRSRPDAASHVRTWASTHARTFRLLASDELAAPASKLLAQTVNGHPKETCQK